MAQNINDYLRESFRSYHEHEPLDADTVNDIVYTIKERFPDESEEDIVDAIEHLFDVEEDEEELPLYKFTSEQYVRAHSEDEAKQIFANTSYDFASNATCERVPFSGNSGGKILQLTDLKEADFWGRPLYKDENDIYYCDISLGNADKPDMHYKGCKDGEPSHRIDNYQIVSE